MLVKNRLIALTCAVALIAAACGSRLDEQELSAGAGTGGGGPAVDADAGKGPGISQGEGENAGPMIGTLPVPCGQAEGGGPSTEAPKGDVPGVTADTIKIAVISDRAGVVKVPTISIEESMKAFVGLCNDFGGIDGRKLDLMTIDSKLFNQLEATEEACDAGVFALVGSGSVTDSSGAQTMVDCGLIEVPAYTAMPAKSLSDNMVQPLPNPANQFNAGPARFIAAKYPDAVKKAAILHSGIEVGDIQAARIIEAYEKEGFEFVYQKRTGVIVESYTSEVKAMKDAGIEYVTMVSATSETTKLLHDMQTQGFEPEVIDLGQQYYDPDLLDEPGAEGSLVQTNTVPFEEANDSPAMQAYLAAYEQVGGDKPPPAALGVQAFSAGLLFATAVHNVGPDFTRDSVLAELKNVHKWDGGGLHMVTDPGANTASTCFMYLEVKDGKFVRYHPEKVVSFDCVENYRIDLAGDYGTGAKKTSG
ncbi:MAG: ABC transporter substrate-binding protein [Aquihabitans sp.]